MRYSPKLYARAFSEAASADLTKKNQDRLVKNFLNTIKNNGDWSSIKKIAAEAEKILMAKAGRRKVTIETARQAKKSALNGIKKKLEPSDVVEERINPSLVAGVKITINDALEFDGSLKRKLDKLFKP